MSQPQTRQAQKNQHKPPRLRSACNQCNIVKLKCSGERDGCQRCRALRADCIYAESRVGKVQGSKRRKKVHDPNSLNLASSTVPLADQGSLNVPTTSEPWAEPWTAQTAWAENMLTLEDELNFDGLLGSSTMTSPVNTSSLSDLTSSSSQATEHSDFRTDMSDDVNIRVVDRRAVSTVQRNHNSNTPVPSRPTNIGLDARELILTPVSGVDPMYTQMVPAQQGKVSGQELSKLDSRCVLACTRILMTLENYLLSDLRALDLILATVGKAVDDVKKLVDLQQRSRCERCITLFTAVMLQVVALLEAGFNTASQELDNFDDILAEPQLGLGSTLCLGAFLPNSEEQRTWRSRIVTKEVQHVREVLSSIMVLARLGPQGVSADPSATDARVGCLGNIEQRLKHILA